MEALTRKAAIYQEMGATPDTHTLHTREMTPAVYCGRCEGSDIYLPWAVSKASVGDEPDERYMIDFEAHSMVTTLSSDPGPLAVHVRHSLHLGHLCPTVPPNTRHRDNHPPQLVHVLV